MSIIESTPDSGVDIKKETVAPLLTPDCLSCLATGRTEQEQSGNGIPITEALKISDFPFPIILSFILDEFRTIEINPASIIPINNKKAESIIISQIDSTQLCKKRINYNPFKYSFACSTANPFGSTLIYFSQ